MNAAEALAGIGVTESDTGPYSYLELLGAMQALLDNPPAQPEPRIIPLMPMKTYQYQRADGRISQQQFSTDATAQRFLQELGENWQLLTPICDAQPLPPPPAHVEPSEQMREAALWVQGGLELLEAGSLHAAKESFRVAIGRLTGAEPARQAPATGLIYIAPDCGACSNGNCSTKEPAA